MAGIGGRRWAKFTKYLLQKKVDVHIIAAKNFGKNISAWHKDIEQIEIENRVTYFKSNYPAYLGIVPKSVVQKIGYRIALFYVKIKIKGNYFDKSAHCRNELLKAVEIQINKGYNNVLISVGPFRYAAYIAELKLKYPLVNFILDVRDPWANNKTSFGFETISKKRLTFEYKLEENTIQKFDKITAVASDINQYFIEKYGQKNDKFYTIHNGFDKQDIMLTVNDTKNNEIKFVFAGTFYNKAIKYVELLVFFLNQLKTNNPELYKLLSFNFYGTVPNVFYKIIEKESSIHFFGEKPLNEIHQIVNNANGAMLFLTDDISYSFSTKFLEYLALRKPIIVFSNDGITGKFVEENGIGYSITKENIETKFLTICNKILNKENMFNETFDINNFSVEKLCNKIKEILI